MDSSEWRPRHKRMVLYANWIVPALFLLLIATVPFDLADDVMLVCLIALFGLALVFVAIHLSFCKRASKTKSLFYAPLLRRSHRWGGHLTLLIALYLGFTLVVTGPHRLKHIRMDRRIRPVVARAQVRNFCLAVENYREQRGEYPENLEVLAGLFLDCDELPLDPWGYSYVYARDEAVGCPAIMSYGRDGKPGGEGYDADIRSRSDEAEP